MSQFEGGSTKPIAVVAGAAGRLGRALGAEFNRRGIRVAAIVRSADEAAGLAGLQSFVCDMTDEASVSATFLGIREHMGPIGHCIHAVGGWDMRPILETSLADWRQLLDVNLTTAFLFCREAVRHMVAEGTGGIVAIASRQGADSAPAGQAAYAASKAGLIRLVEAVAAEHGSHGLTTRVVAPSTILFEGDSGDGIPVAELARLCVDLSYPSHDAPNGSVTRAYGTAL